MRKKLLSFLKCPNTQLPDLKIYGFEVLRNNEILSNVTESEMQDEDDIVSGILINESSKIVYPIDQCVAVLLSFNDADPIHINGILKFILEKCPDQYKESVSQTLEKTGLASSTSDGIWNREEMRYYDSEVESRDHREQMLSNIKNIPVHRILIPRKWHITKIIKPFIKNSAILEIGCGNANTIYNILNPGINNYPYTGTDISFKRLLVAKMAIPEGDFIQASALNLPFIKNSFTAVISFGMLHHLPRPVQAVEQVMPLIKSNGFFAFHEPVIRSSINLPGTALIKKAMSTYQHSEHDGKINLDEILISLTKSSFTTYHIAYQVSSLRSIAETIIKKISRKIMLNKQVILFIENTDRLILKSISNKSGAKAVFVVSQKQ